MTTTVPDFKISKGLNGQDDNLDALFKLFEELQLITAEAANPELDLITFAQSAYYFGVITLKPITSSSPASSPPGSPGLGRDSPLINPEPTQSEADTRAVQESSSRMEQLIANLVDARAPSNIEFSQESYTTDLHAISRGKQPDRGVVNHSAVSEAWKSYKDPLFQADYTSGATSRSSNYIDSSGGSFYPAISATAVHQRFGGTNSDSRLRHRTTGISQEMHSTVYPRWTAGQNSTASDPLTTPTWSGVTSTSDYTPMVQDEYESEAYNAGYNRNASSFSDNREAYSSNFASETVDDIYSDENEVDISGGPIPSLSTATLPSGNAHWGSTQSPLTLSAGSDRAIGIVYLTASQNFGDPLHIGELNIGIILDPGYRKKGIANKAVEEIIDMAFRDNTCHRVQAILVDCWAKDRALDFFTKKTFSHEGTRRRAFFGPFDHEWKDTTYLAVLDTDWALRNRRSSPAKLAPQSLWDELFARHQREREELLRWDERNLKRTLSMETIREYSPVDTGTEISDAESSFSDALSTRTAASVKRRRTELSQERYRDANDHDADDDHSESEAEDYSGPAISRMNYRQDSPLSIESMRSSPALSESSVASVPRSVTPDGYSSSSSVSQWDVLETSSVGSLSGTEWEDDFY